MALRLNQGGEAASWAEAEPGKQEDLKSREHKGPRFQEKKGSVFPVKKKLVKTMMVDCIAKSLSSSSRSISSTEASLSSNVGGSSKMTAPSKSSKGKKSTLEIFPDP